uniref:PSI domain-containing protein n=1 Tax=Caenorhabditis tropicalis TaxID=1561998 RepID=A0A1I7TFT6_9PELO
MRRISLISLSLILVLRIVEAQNIEVSKERVPETIRYSEPSTAGPNSEDEFVPLSPVRRARAAPIPKRSVLFTESTEDDVDPATATVPPDVEVQQDSVDHQYYQAETYVGDEEKLKKYWVNVEQFMKKPKTIGNMSHPLLSQSYRRAVGARLQFKFPFYGHKMANLTIATGGFIYIGDHTHNWLAATQYIAPLMANFHTYLPNSNIVYADDGESFVVEWRNVQLKEDKDKSSDSFTFQTILHKNGDIVFIYKDVPYDISNISDANHPVKLGISDAYMFKHNLAQSTAPKRVIYEYHRIELAAKKIVSNTVVILKAQPTCISFETCDSCTNATLPHFNCLWCHAKKSHGGPFCTDESGLHRRRQQWFEGNCYQRSKALYCDAEEDENEVYDDEDYIKPQYIPRKTELPASSEKPAPHIDEWKKQPIDKETRGGVATLTMIVLLLVCIVGWLAYAYYYPHTTSGQLLIKYRPSRWHIPNSHVRYSASVHM